MANAPMAVRFGSLVSETWAIWIFVSVITFGIGCERQCDEWCVCVYDNRQPDW